MTRADRIAIEVKATIHQLKQLQAVPSCVTLNPADHFAVLNNNTPCDPPDYVGARGEFCGLPLLYSDRPYLPITVGIVSVMSPQKPDLRD